MRNLLKYPVTREEAVQCLDRMCDKAVADDEMAMRVGNLDTYILKCAATLIAHVDHDVFHLAFGITDDTGGDDKTEGLEDHAR